MLHLSSALADASAPAEARAQVVAGPSSVRCWTPTSVSLLSSVTAQRWSSASDMVDGIEELALRAASVAASGRGPRRGSCCGFSGADRRDPGSELALGSRLGDESAKGALVTTLLEGRASGADGARRVLDRARCAGSQGASAADAGDDDRHGPAFALGRDRHHRDAAGRRADRPPQGRALAALRRGPISLNTVIDPTIVGGLRVQIADDVIDASISAEARRPPPASRRLSTDFTPVARRHGGDFGAEAP